MKKILCVLSVLAFTMTIASAAESKLQSYVNKKLEPAAKKEQQLREKAEANKKANEAKKAELKKQQEQCQKDIEKKKKEAEAKRQETKNAINAEKSFWQNLLNK